MTALPYLIVCFYGHLLNAFKEYFYIGSGKSVCNNLLNGGGGLSGCLLCTMDVFITELLFCSEFKLHPEESGLSGAS